MKHVFSILMAFLIGIGAIYGQDDPGGSAVYNQTKQTGYSDFAKAWNTAADNDVLIVNEDVSVSVDKLPGNGRTLTVKGGTEGVRIIRAKEKCILFLINNASDNITFEDIVFDGNNMTSTTTIVEVSNGKVVLNNVSAINEHTSATAGHFQNKGSGHLEINGLTVNNCSVADGRGDVFAGNNNVTMSGNCNFSLFAEKALHANDAGVSGGNITVFFEPDKRGTNMNIIQGASTLDSYTCGVSGYKFILDNDYIKIEEDTTTDDNYAVYNRTTGKGFDSLMDAWTAALTGDMLVLNEPATVTALLEAKGRAITVTSKEGTTQTVSRAEGYTDKLFITNNNNDGSNGVVNLENIVIDGAGIATSGQTIEASGNGTANLTGVSIKNVTTTNNQGLISVKSGGHLNVNGLSVADCTVPDGRGMIFVGTNNVSIAGECEFSIFLEKNNSNAIHDNGVTDGSTVTLLFEETRVDSDNALVTGVTYDNAYKCGIADKFLSFDNGNIYAVSTVAPVIPEDTKPVYNKTSDKGYSSLMDAWTAAATGDVLVLNEPATVTARLNADGRAITVTSKEGTNQTVARAEGYNGILFLTNSGNGSNGEVNLENIVIDGAGIATSNQTIEASGNGTANLTGVNIKNVATDNGQGLISVKGGGHLNVNGLSVAECTVPEDSGIIYVGTNNVSIAGECEFSIFLQDNHAVADAGVTAGSKVTLLFDAGRADSDYADSALITGATATEAYDCGVADYKLTSDNNGNIYAVSTKVPVVPEDSKAVYNSTSGKGFDSLVAAWGAAVSDDVLVLNEPATVTERLNANGRAITIRSKEGTRQTITRAENYTGILFLPTKGSDTNGSISLEGVTVDGNNVAGCAPVVEASQNGALIIKDVVMTKCISSDNGGIVTVKNSGGNGTLTIDGLSFSECSVPEGRGLVSAIIDGMSIKGLCDFSLFIEGGHSVADAGLAEGSKITLLFDADRADSSNADSPLITGATSADAFICGVADYELKSDDSGNIAAVSTKIPEIPEDAKPVYNSTSKKGFNSIAAAWGAAATGDVLVLNEPATVTERLNANGRAITVTSKEGTKQTIARAEGYTGILFLTSAGEDSNGEINLDNVIINGAGIATSGQTIEASGNGTAHLNGVSILNVKTDNGQGLISVKDGGHLNVNGLSVTDCTVPEGRGMIFAGTDNVSLAGTCDFSLFIEGARVVTDKGVTEGSSVTLLFDAGRADSDYADNALVTGATYADAYKCGVADYNLNSDNSGNIYAASTKVPVVPEDSKAVYNKTSDKGFDSLVAAWNAAATGDVLVLNEPATVTERLNANGRAITVTSKEGTKQTVARAENFDGILFLTSASENSNGEINLDNVIIDGTNIVTSGQTIEASGNGTANLNGVSIKNVKTDNGQGLISVKGGGHLNVNGLSVADCTVPDGSGMIFAGTNGVSVAGTCDFSLFIEGGNAVADKGVTEGSKVTLLFDAGRADSSNADNALVTGATATEAYVCGVVDYKLTSDNNGNIYAVSTKVPVVPEDSKAVYNSTSGKGFDSLVAAWGAAASNDVLVLNEPATVTERLNANGRAITIRSKEGTRQTITRAENYTGILFLPTNTSDANGSITLEGVTVDGNNVAGSAPVVETSHNGTVLINDVVMTKCISSDNAGIVTIKNSGGNGTLTINGLSFSECSVPEGRGLVSAIIDGMSIKGLCDFSLFIEGGHSVADAGLAEGSKITLLFDADRADSSNADSPLITGATSADAFICGVADYELKSDDSGNIAAVSTKIPEIPEDAKPVYNSTSKKGFNSIAAAWGAAATGDVLVLNEPATVNERLNANGRAITVTSKEGTKQTVARAEGYTGILFLTNSGNDSNGEINLDNVIIDGAGIATSGQTIEASGNGTANLTGVSIKNVTTDNGQGLISVKGGGHLNVNGLSVADCTVPDASGMIFAGTNNVTIAGLCQFSLFIEGGNAVADKGLTEGSAVTLLFAADRADSSNADSALITGAASSEAYTCGVADYKLSTDDSGNIIAVSTKVSVIPEDSKAVYNKTSDKGFDSLAAAWTAAATGDVLVLNQPATVSERLNANGRAITVTSKEGTKQTVARAEGYNGILFLTSAGEESNGEINLDNVIIDGANIATSGQTIEASGNGTANLTGVSIKNVKTDHGQGLISVKGGGHLNVNGLSVADCTVPDGSGMIFAGTDGVSVAGACDFSLFIEGARKVADKGVAEGSKITLLFDAGRADSEYADNALVTGASVPDAYSCGVADYKLTSDNSGNIYAVSTKVPVVPEDTKAVYNKTSGKGFDSLVAAWGAAATGDVLVLNEPATVTERLNANGRAITVTSKEGTKQTVARAEDYNGILFLTNSGNDSNGEISLDNVVIDGAGIATSGQTIEASGNGTANLTGVSIKNVKTDNGQGLISVKNGGHLNVNGLSVADCTVPDGSGMIFAGTDGVSVAGACDFSILIEGARKVADKGVAEGSSVTLLFDAGRADSDYADSPLVTGATYTDVYACGVADYKLTSDESGNIYAVSTKAPVIPEDSKAVYNKTTNKGFASLLSAWNAAATGDVLVLNQPATVAERLNANGRAITVTSKEGTKQTVARADGYNGILFLTNSGNDSNGEISLDNVIIDGANIATSGQTIEASGNGTANLTGVSIKNVKTDNAQGIISVKGGGHLNVNGLSVADCTVPEGRGMFFAGTDGVSIEGACDFSLFIEGARKVADKGVAEGSSVTLLFDADRTDSDFAESPLVTGATYADVYASGVADYILTSDESGNIFVVSTKEPVIPEEPKAVYNKTSDKGFDSLVSAWNAAATGDVLVLNQPATVTERLNANGRAITVTSKEGTKQTVARAEGYNGILFLTNSGNDANGEISLDNVIIDGAGIATSGQTIEASGNGTANLTGVTIKNVTTDHGQGIISVKGGGHLNVNGLSVADCTVPEGRGMLFAGTDGVSIEGSCDFSLFIEGARKVADKGVAEGSSVTLLFDADRAESDYAESPLVTGAAYADVYACGVADYSLTSDESGNIYAVFTEAPVIPEEPKAVYNQTSDKGFDSLVAAWNAAATGDVLVLNEPATVTERLNANGRAITVTSKEGTKQTVARAEGYNGILFLTNSGNDANGEISLDNVIIDGAGIATSGQTIEASGNGTANLTGVTIKNVTTDHGQGIISVKGGGHLNVNGLSVADCTVPEGRGMLFAGTDGVSIEGACGFSIFIEGARKVADKGVAEGSSVTLLFDADRADGDYAESPLVTGATSLDPYVCGVLNYRLTLDESGNIFAVSTIVPVIPEDSKPVYNSTSGFGFDSLVSAWNAAADGDVLVLNQPAVVTERLNDNGRAITVISKEGTTQTISRDASFDGFLFYSSTWLRPAGEITLENVIIDGAGIDSSSQLIEASKNGTINLIDIRIINAVTSNDQGLISAKNSGKLYIDNLTIEDAIVPEGRGEIFAGSDGIVFRGECAFTILLDKSFHANDEGFIDGNIGILINPDNRDYKAPVILGTSSSFGYECLVVDHSIDCQDGALYIIDDLDAVDSIAGDAEGLVDIFTIDGKAVRARVPASEALRDLTPGIYIVNGRKTLIRQ